MSNKENDIVFEKLREELADGVWYEEETIEEAIEKNKFPWGAWRKTMAVLYGYRQCLDGRWRLSRGETNK